VSTGSEAEQWLPVLDFNGFAQEFLRRNREYRAQYAKISEATARDPLSREAREMTGWTRSLERLCDGGRLDLMGLNSWKRRSAPSSATTR
jgi:Family of unknown function (DUF6499)